MITNSSKSLYQPNALSFAQLLQVYIAIAVFAHFACLFFNGYGGDLGYWFSWISQLTSYGYKSLNANYPPIYIHWIYATSKIIPALNAPLENNLMLKTLLELPTLVCHLIVIGLVNQLLNKSNADRVQRHCILFLTALNPAILFNGPVWGQVDIIPVTFALASLLAFFSPRFCSMSIPLYTLAILTKFQMICFAPIMGILFFRNLKANIIGICISALIIAIAFAPFIYHHEFLQYAQKAYISTLGEYAYTTFNASNIWMLLTSNATPDTHTMFTINQIKHFSAKVTAKHFGMALFAFVCLIVFLRGIAQQISKKMGDPQKQQNDILFYALICAMAFFTVLPAMHERYLFPAVIIALAYAAANPKRLIYALLVTLVCFINMAIINGINGSDIWTGLSSLMLYIFAFALLEFFAGRPLYIFLQDIFKRITKLKWLGIWVFAGFSSLFIAQLSFHFHIYTVTLADNQVLLTELAPTVATQSYGTLRNNRSVDDHVLSIGDKRFANGLGTHTQSVITFQLPEGAKEFSAIVGVDDESGTADMEFSVWGDGKKLWQSPVYYGFEDSKKIEHIDITGIHELSLHVDPVTDVQFDHADWINPIITFDHKVR